MPADWMAGAEETVSIAEYKVSLNIYSCDFPLVELFLRSTRKGRGFNYLLVWSGAPEISTRRSLI